jgi:hypothetical protein
MPLYPSFVYAQKANQLFGAAVVASGVLEQVDSTVRDAYVAAGLGLGLDLFPAAIVDMAKNSYANAAGVVLTFTGTTPITLDFTNLVAATGVVVKGVGTWAGSFATWTNILIQNIGAASEPIAVSPGASNPLRTALGGTTPTYTLATGDVVHMNSSATAVVDATHKTITFTPTSGGLLLLFAEGT